MEDINTIIHIDFIEDIFEISIDQVGQKGDQGIQGIPGTPGVVQYDIDGGFANSVYLVSQLYDGGNA